MKTLKTVFLILLFSAAYLQKAKAQYSDYVVTTKGDTIKCVVGRGGTAYKAANMKHYKYFNFDEISAYFLIGTGTLYRAIVKPYENDEDTVFAEVVEQGKINLYKIPNQQMYFPNNNNNIIRNKIAFTWYISKVPGHIESIKLNFSGDVPVNNRNNAFAEMIKDNKDIYSRYTAGDKISIDGLRILIYEYNKSSP